MNAMSNAEKQQAYRDRLAAKEIADALFDGQFHMTIKTFMENVKFDEASFYWALDGLGEETEEYVEERDSVYQAAYNEAYQEEYDEAYQAAVAAAETDPEEENDAQFDQIEESAREAAEEAAEEAVKELESSVEDYSGTCVEYSLVDLIHAYKAAQAILGR